MSAISTTLDGTLGKYAVTYANTSRAIYYQTAEDLIVAKMRQAGEPVYWEYIGPADSKNRDECVYGLHKRFFTDAERTAFEDTYGVRYNCRHTFMQVTEYIYNTKDKVTEDLDDKEKSRRAKVMELFGEDGKKVEKKPSLLHPVEDKPLLTKIELQNIKSGADEIHKSVGNNIEMAILYDSDGRIILSKQGTKHNIPFDTQEEYALLQKGSLFVHNHPRGAMPLSSFDVEMAWRNNIKVTAFHKFSDKRYWSVIDLTDNNNITEKAILKLRKETAKALIDAQKILVKSEEYMSGKYTKRKALNIKLNMDVQTKLLKDFCNKYNINYGEFYD